MAFAAAMPLFETACQNIGMRLLAPRLAYLIVQQDEVFHEAGWNLWLAAGLTDATVFAVGGRCGLRPAACENMRCDRRAKSLRVAGGSAESG